MNRPRRLFGAGLVLAFGLAGALVALGEVPQWVPGGSRMQVHRALASYGPLPLPLRHDGVVVVVGDSNATAGRIGIADPWPTWLARRLGPGVRVLNLSRGGYTAPRWLEREALPPAMDICILAFGTNDGAARGWLFGKRAIGREAFAGALGQLIRTCRARGASVLVLAAPPAGSRAIERRVAPYREAARAVAHAAGAAFVDPMEAFGLGAGRPGAPPLLGYDALHLTAPAHGILGRWLATRIRVSTLGLQPELPA